MCPTFQGASLRRRRRADIPVRSNSRTPVGAVRTFVRFQRGCGQECLRAGVGGGIKMCPNSCPHLTLHCFSTPTLINYPSYATATSSLAVVERIVLRRCLLFLAIGGAVGGKENRGGSPPGPRSTLHAPRSTLHARAAPPAPEPGRGPQLPAGNGTRDATRNTQHEPLRPSPQAHDHPDGPVAAGRARPPARKRLARYGPGHAVDPRSSARPRRSRELPCPIARPHQ